MGNQPTNEWGLTAKQEAFAQELACGSRPKDAYRTTYNAGSMKSTTISSRSSELNRHPKIKARVAMLLGKAVDKGDLKVERVLAELGALSFTNMKDYGRWDNDSFDLVASEHLTDVQASAISSIEMDETVTTSVQGDVTVKRKIRFKLYNKPDALDKLAKVLRMYTGEAPEGAEVNVNGPVVVFAQGAVHEALREASKALQEAGVVAEDIPYKISENGAVH